MKISVKKYLLYSSVFAIFTEAFFFHFIIDWKLLYLIIFINFYFVAKLKKLTINKSFLFLLLFLLFHSILTNLIVGVPPNFMLSQLLGIAIISIYYYNFISLYENKHEIINVYLKLCLFASILGLLMWILRINCAYEPRLHGIFKEPAHYVVVVIPATYYYLKQKQFLKFLIIFISIILSQSSIGYIGCALMFIISYLNYKRLIVLTVIIPITAWVLYLGYQYNNNIQMRVDDTYESFNAIKTGKFKNGTNVSSYALMSNLFVTKCNFIDHPFGSGIGSHYYMHKNIYSKMMRPPEYIVTLKLDDINANDANSLFLRIISELGVFGIIIILFFLYKSSKCFKYKLYLAQGIVIYILLKLFREGHYFSPELYFFIWLLYFSIYESFQQRKLLA